MADHNEVAPSAPAPVYQLPEWETITHPPKPRQSLLGRILPIKGSSDEPSTAAEQDGAKERSGQTSTLPLHASTNAENSSANPTLATSLRTRLDSAFPPHKTYFGRPRRFLFLYVVLPVAIFLFLLVPLGVGLGVGLSRRFRRHK
ncbi:uncharacterized protein F4807DRAFT_330012 [Annulohypoxylon truncatum]|uniref:uncharacterized protein n=1 Tax=Annulohypoxylon truncatum TaxID=327061 RepID=UPI002008225C|nr:uncharacterized protein F4807DRAFT_330012 [Annulohypoxylon truncatum]KAI1204479.1 hypothetical protein F4807DRAFT_330012 [Annulohypoxylon truncatum]